MRLTNKILKQLLKENQKLSKKIDILSKELEMLKGSKQDIHYHFHNNNNIQQPLIPQQPFINPYPTIPSDYPYPFFGYPTTICDTNIGDRGTVSISFNNTTSSFLN